MFPEFVVGALKNMGGPGAAIMVLLLVVVSLAGAIVHMYRRENKIYGFRLAERDTLNKALQEAAVAIANMIKATAERNEVTEELASAVNAMATKFEILSKQIELQHTMTSKELAGLVMSISEHSKSIVEFRTYLIQARRIR